ncbi:FAD-dependent oxidoreductase [Roseateles koreensis]|uniref:FAD-dependent oxidoreductase n=1 Tax=Roseateles koreensis TaxID=2987526 RepID=A0ABT5KNS8_9BURK|nr:FAD-dependent oxidoreductase [Roseateles koreensis]MDC8784574.1 FAD-dependent oxidoreductase [Roseateles koreensis]
MSLLHADVLVVGAGPAGIAAVCTLAEAGKSVIWIDAGLRAGGQIWRSDIPQPWRERLTRAQHQVRWLSGHTVIAAEMSPAGHTQLLLHNLQSPLTDAHSVEAPHVLLALGARERFLPFPGWTLPGVTGAGALQALAKEGAPLRGKRVVLAGSGPLLWAAAHTLQVHGALLELLAEQASRSQLVSFTMRLNPQLWTQTVRLAWALRRVPQRQSCWVERALGDEKLEAVQLTDGQRRWTQPCEALGVGFGLLPNTELAELMGCQLKDGAIQVDARQQTSRPGIYAAGECTGIAGMHKAVLEGQLAAQALLSGNSGGAGLARLAGALQRARRHGDLLQRQFTLRPELFKLADAQTLICRCEDVNLGALKTHQHWRDAKLQTRCGMGACQGRICGPICQDVLGWPADPGVRGVRMPLQPAPIAALLANHKPIDSDSTIHQGAPSIL